nr:hypothetical protein [Tanacetum cinerariifolium]
MNEDSLVFVESTIKEGVTPSVVDMMMENDKISSLDYTIVPESFPTLTTPVSTTTGNTPGKSSYANITGKLSGKKVSFRTLFTPEGNGIDVVVPVDSIRAINERFANTAYGFFLGKKVAYHVVANYKWHPDENLLKEDVRTVPVWVKLHGVPVTAFSEDGLSAIATKMGTPLMLDSYTSDMCMQFWVGMAITHVISVLNMSGNPLRCSSCKVFGHINEECQKNKSASEKKTVKKRSQASRGVPVGLKMAFKSQKEYRSVTKKPNTSSSGIKKKGVKPTIEVSNLNPFDTLNSVDNDVEFERQIDEGKLRLLDNDENQLVPTGIVKSDSEVEVVYDDTANLMIPTSVYCDDLDITVRGRKKK